MQKWWSVVFPRVRVDGTVDSGSFASSAQYFCLFCLCVCVCMSSLMLLRFFPIIFNFSPHRWIWSHHNFGWTCFFYTSSFTKVLVVLFFGCFFPLFNRKFFSLFCILALLSPHFPLFSVDRAVHLRKTLFLNLWFWLDNWFEKIFEPRKWMNERTNSRKTTKGKQVRRY